MTQRRRRGPILAAVLIFALVGLWAVVFFHDGPAPDDRDLRRRERPQLPAEQNSAAVWLEIRQNSSLLKSHPFIWPDPTDNLVTSATALVAATSDEINLVRRWAESSESSLQQLRDGLQTTEFSLPEKVSTGEVTLGIRSLSSRAWLAMIDGDSRDAWTWLQASKEWQRRFLREMRPVDSLMLLANSAFPRHAERLLATELPAGDSVLVRALQATRKSPIPDGWEARFLRSQYAELSQKLADNWYFKTSLKRSPPDGAERFFRLHRTQSKLAEWTRLAIAQLDTPRLNKRVFAELREEPSRFDHYLQLATGNAGGEWILRHGFVLPSEYTVGALKLVQVDSDLAQLVIAVRLFEIRKGRLPERLESLVPAILPALPDDPYSETSASYKYDPVKRELRSVSGASVILKSRAAEPAPSPRGS